MRKEDYRCTSICCKAADYKLIISKTKRNQFVFGRGIFLNSPFCTVNRNPLSLALSFLIMNASYDIMRRSSLTLFTCSAHCVVTGKMFYAKLWKAGVDKRPKYSNLQFISWHGWSCCIVGARNFLHKGVKEIPLLAPLPHDCSFTLSIKIICKGYRWHWYWWCSGVMLCN